MSLVIASNSDNDAALRQDTSIYSAWSFKNSLSSTFQIPEDAQVCLQSAKYNVDGRVTLTPNNSVFYSWFGDDLTQLPGSFEESTSYPVVNRLGEGQFQEVDTEDLSTLLKDTLQKNTFHPNQKDQITTSVYRNASGEGFNGYQVSFNQQVAQADADLGDDSFENWGGDETAIGTFSGNTGVFQRNGSAAEALDCSAINLQAPLSLTGTELRVLVDSKDPESNVNDRDLPWGVGLSRYAVHNGYTGVPYEAPEVRAIESPWTERNIWTDYAVTRREDGALIVTQSVWSDEQDGLVQEEVFYWLNPTSNLSGAGPYDMDSNPAGIKSISFKMNGEKIELQAVNSLSSFINIVPYNAAAPRNSQFTPISQACWCLHPVLYVGANASHKDSTIQITKFQPPTLTSIYNPKVAYQGGWYETLYLQGDWDVAKGLESRLWNQTYDKDGVLITDPPKVPIVLNGASGVAFRPALIVKPSDVYKNTELASTAGLLGFANRAVVNAPYNPAVNLQVYKSDNEPDAYSVSIFVRLNNLGQQVLNARQGNRSSIIAHLPRQEVTTSRKGLFYEPNEKNWLDLNNGGSFPITEFDISFSYINEQFAEVLTGQSIVALLFRKKPLSEK
jgi:hypothetical protein